MSQFFFNLKCFQAPKNLKMLPRNLKSLNNGPNGFIHSCFDNDKCQENVPLSKRLNPELFSTSSLILSKAETTSFIFDSDGLTNYCMEPSYLFIYLLQLTVEGCLRK